MSAELLVWILGSGSSMNDRSYLFQNKVLSELESFSNVASSIDWPLSGKAENQALRVHHHTQNNEVRVEYVPTSD